MAWPFAGQVGEAAVDHNIMMAGDDSEELRVQHPQPTPVHHIEVSTAHQTADE